MYYFVDYYCKNEQIMNPINLGKKNSAAVLEVLTVLGRPATVAEVAQRMASIYKVPQEQLQPMLKDLLKRGVRLGFLRCQNRQYELVDAAIAQLRREIDEYVHRVLHCSGKSAAKPSPLMLKLEQLSNEPNMVQSPVRSTAPFTLSTLQPNVEMRAGGDDGGGMLRTMRAPAELELERAIQFR